MALPWLLEPVELVDEEGGPVSRDDLRADQGLDAQDGAGAPGEEEDTGDGGAEDGGARMATAAARTDAENGEAEA